MPWFIPWSDVLKKKVCRYLLQRYLGQFMDEKLSLEQLNVDLYNGTGTVSNIALYSKSLNDLCESQKWPVEVVEGHLGSVTVNVPWNALMSEDGYIEIANLYLAIKPRPIDQTTDGKSVLESMFSSMSSSMQLAQDCMERERLTPANLQATAMEGLEKFAMTIDNVLNRIKAKLFNTELRIEYILPDDSNRGLALIIKVGHISYENEAGKEMKAEDETPTTASQLDKDFDEESVARGSNNKEEQQQHQSSKKDDKEVYYLSAYAIHHITLKDIAIFTEEFTIVDQQQEKRQRQTEMKSPMGSEGSDGTMGGGGDQTRSQLLLQDSVMSEQFYSTISEFPIPELQSSVLDANYDQDEDDEENGSEEEEEEEEEDERPSMKIYSSGELQIAALNGLHEIRISMKQSESVIGANVELEVNLGVLELLLTPRQCHMMSVILESFSPLPPPPPTAFNLSDSDVGARKQSQSSKNRQKSTHNDEDYATAFRSQFNNMSGGFSYEASHHQHPGSEAGRGGGGGGRSDWHASELRSNIGADSLMSSSSTTTSSSMSSASTMVNSTRSRRTVTMTQDYDSVLISTYCCRIGGVVSVLLHDDILMDTQAMSAVCYGPPLTEASCQQMQILGGAFFSELKKLNLVAELRQLPVVEQQHLDKLVTQYHLRLLLATIILEGEERRNPKENLLQFNGSVVKVRLSESLGALKVPLLDFAQSPGDLTRVPHVQVTHQSLQRVHLLNGIEYLSEPVVKCRVNLSPCLIELDISIYDRLKVLSESYPFQLTRARVERQQRSEMAAAQEAAMRSNRRGKRKSTPAFSLTVNLDQVDIHLRFPVADLRPVHDPQRVPWWERNVRSDYLVVRLQRARVANVKTDILSIEADEFLLFYVENEAVPLLVPLGTCSGRVDSDTHTQHLPSIIIDMSEVGVGGGAEEGSKEASSGTPPSPFARSKTCRESDTPHRKGPGSLTTTTTEESEVLVMPGNREELRTFTDFALKNSKMRLTIHLPKANVQLKSKHIYELLYNRINSDLLLWTPGSHQLVVPANSGGGAGDLLFNVGLMDSVYAPSVSHEIEDSDEEEQSEDDDEEGGRYGRGSDDGLDSDQSDEIYTFKSINQRRRNDRRRRNRRRRNRQSSADATNTNECEFAFCLQVDELSITMFPPARNANNQVIPEQHGEFLMRAERLKVVSVKGFCGNENLGYVCLDADALSISHCGLAPPSPPPKGKKDQKQTMDHLLKTIYPTPDRLTLNGLPDHQSSRKMLSLALQIRLCPEQEMKRMRLAAVVHTATLKHNNPALNEQSWLMELMDMFDVVDYPIPGYKAAGTITEMHIHLWDLCVDYRPLFFPFRAVATLGNLEISTNVTSQASIGCTLRFVAEDSALSLGPQLVGSAAAEGKDVEKAAEEVAIFNDKRDLVCVLELGLFEISLRLSERETSFSPKFDLRAAVHDVHIRTCADSARALAEFLGYVAVEGDLNHKEESDEEEEHETMDNESADLLSTEANIRVPQENDLVAAEVAQNKQRHVTNLMEDAMLESRVGRLPADLAEGEEEGEEDDDDEFGDEMFLRTGTEIFFFPDEGNKSVLPPAGTCVQHEDIMGVSVCLETLEGRSDYNTMTPDLDETLPQVEEELGAIPSMSYAAAGEGSSTMRPERRTPQMLTKQQQQQPATNTSDADEDYCIIGDEEKVAFAPTNLSEPVQLAEEPIRIVDNHFTMPTHKTDLLQAPADFPMALVRYTLCEMTITWHMYGGSDFGRAGRHNVGGGTMTKKNLAADEEPEEVIYLGMSDAYRQGVSYSTGGGAAKKASDASGVTWRTCGGPDRRQDVLIEFQLNRVRFSHETYPMTTKHASRQVLLCHEFEIRDKLAVSNINKLLYNNNNSNAFGPLRSPRHMLMIEAVHIRPDNPLPAQECCLRVSLSPLRLNIDQDALLFLVGFFQEFGGAAADGEMGGNAGGGGGDADPDALNSTERTTLVDPPAPVLMVDLPEALQELQARKMVSENLQLLMDEGEGRAVGGQGETASVASTATTTTYEVDDTAPVYFRSVRFEPAVQIRIDYHGKRVELSRGPLAGLIMGLGQLQASEFKLKAIKSKQGFLGIEALLNYFIRMWLQDIKKNQLPSILSGVGPMHAFVQLFQGIFDLFWMPIEQYKKDGKLVRGLQRGAKSFTARTALAALEITTRLIYILQLTAETAYDMVSPGPRTLRRGRNRRIAGRRKKKNRVQQPQDIREGVVNAYHIVRDGIGETVQNILEVAALEHDQKGYTGAVGAVVREIPSTMVRPLVLATQATNHVLGGVKNQLVPDARTEMREKWKAEED